MSGRTRLHRTSNIHTLCKYSFSLELKINSATKVPFVMCSSDGRVSQVLLNLEEICDAAMASDARRRETTRNAEAGDIMAEERHCENSHCSKDRSEGRASIYEWGVPCCRRPLDDAGLQRRPLGVGDDCLMRKVGRVSDVSVSPPLDGRRKSGKNNAHFGLSQSSLLGAAGCRVGYFISPLTQQQTFTLMP